MSFSYDPYPVCQHGLPITAPAGYSTLSFFITHGNTGSTGRVDAGFKVRVVLHVLKVSIRIAHVGCPGGLGAFFHVVGSDAAALFDLGDQSFPKWLGFSEH